VGRKLEDGELLLLTPDWWRFVADARRATLATIGADGLPSLVPICFVVLGEPAPQAICSPLDEKPKRSADPRGLRRVRDLLADSRATLLVDRWDEDWTRLAFVELEVAGSLLGPGDGGHAQAIDALRAKYPQYATHRLEARPMLRLAPVRVTARWAADRSEALRSS
jgi:PPOX class probable F420-dependent enzyme